MPNLRITHLWAVFFILIFSIPLALTAQEEKAAQEELPIYALVN